jgi:hypothetical protein
MVYKIPEDCTDVPKHVGVVKDYTDLFVICAFVRFYYVQIIFQPFKTEIKSLRATLPDEICYWGVCF